LAASISASTSPHAFLSSDDGSSHQNGSLANA
jgi:hypothetical protein